MTSPVPRVPMTADELAARDCLKGVRMLPASWEKRFRNFICEMDTISEKETGQLFRLLYKYRRQWSHPEKARLLALALENAAPEFRKVNAAARDQARIDEMKEKYGQPQPSRVFELE